MKQPVDKSDDTVVQQYHAHFIAGDPLLCTTRSNGRGFALRRTSVVPVKMVEIKMHLLCV